MQDNSGIAVATRSGYGTRPSAIVWTHEAPGRRRQYQVDRQCGEQFKKESKMEQG